MRSDDESDTPPRKRQRMSSPTYDEQLPFPSQAELQALDGFTYSQQLAAAISKGSSQPDHVQSEHEYGPPPSAGFTNAAALHRIAHSSQSDGDNPFIEAGAGFTSAKSFAVASNLPSSGSGPSLESPTKRPAVGFSAASRLPLARSPSPDAPPEPDYAAWFAPSQPSAIGAEASAALFTTGKGRALMPSKAALQAAEARMNEWDEDMPAPAAASSTAPADPAPMIGFATAKGRAVAPSTTALKAAQVRMQQWEAETEEESENIPGLMSTTSNTGGPSRPILAPVHNSPGRSKTAERSKHPGFASPISKLPVPSFTSAAAPSFASAAARTGVQTDLKGKAVQRPFSSPLLSRGMPPSKPTGFASPLNPHSSARAGTTGFSTPVKAFRPPLPASAASTSALETPVRRAAATFDTPLRAGTPPPRALGVTPLRRGPKKFTTPFKAGMAPGQPGRAVLAEKLRQDQLASASQARGSSTPGSPVPMNAPRTAKHSTQWMFDLTIPNERTTLVDSELYPGTYDVDELADLGLPVDELQQITPTTALYYLFNPSSTPSLGGDPPSTQAMLGPASAHAALQSLGGTLASRAWVDNAWSLILWKLAGLACLDPHREQDRPSALAAGKPRRWSYDHVLEQLRYRYARELLGGSRPALRMVAAQDVNAAAPMVLCVSDVIWPAGSSSEDTDIRPELEVTDGWYRLRAEVDAPLARAARAGKIVRGRKIAFAGARFVGRPEPTEILEGALESVKLSLDGNSSCLAPWHAKLGLLKTAPPATLHSLTPDGGGVHLLDLVVSKVFPIAFIEFVDEPGVGGAKGKTRREGPRKEADEARAQAKWEDRRMRVAEKLRVETEKKWRTWEGWAGALARKGGGRVPIEDDGMPGHIEELLDELIDSGDINALSRAITTADAGWLACALRGRIDAERENAAEELERELAKECPVRNVKSFRVLFMKDAKTDRRPARRTAEVTVWDVMNLAFEEGRQGHFAEGHRFLVSNLQPNQAGAWMSTRDEDSHVYLRTVKNTRWTKL